MAKKKSIKHCTSEAQKRAIARSYAQRKAQNAKQAQSGEKIDMHLAKIKNRYFYKSDKGDSTHTYAVYKDSKTVRFELFRRHIYMCPILIEWINCTKDFCIK